MNQKTVITIAVVVAAGAVAYHFYRKQQTLSPVARAPQNGNPNVTNNGVASTIGAITGAVQTVSDLYTGTKRFDSMEGVEASYGNF